MYLLQVHDKIISQLQLQVERQKMNVGHCYILCQHLNCKCYLVNMIITIVPCFTNICMHCICFKKQIFIEIVKTNKPTTMKICFFSLKGLDN
jgi:hypothetical protein